MTRGYRSRGYRPNGSGHRALEALSEAGYLTRSELRHAVYGNVPSNHRTRKFTFLLVAMERDGLITSRHNVFSLAGGGRPALAMLSAGISVASGDEPQSRTSVRIFVRAA